MESIISTIILSLVQGITEFLPISSSGHLVLVPYIFGIDGMGLGFSVALHIGTLLAVVAYFYRDWMEILQLGLNKEKGGVRDMHHYTYTKRTFRYLIIATIPAVVVGLFLGSFIEKMIQYPIAVAILIGVSGAVLWVADIVGKHKREVGSLRTQDVIIIGCAQVLALVPGVSRSGMTITAGLFLGLTRTQAARFSFLMATPIILGASILKVPDLFRSGLGWEVLLGIIISFLSAFFTIKYMLAFIEKVRYQVFCWYSISLVFIILAFTFAQ